jgi:hypothetical protein
MRSKLVVFAIAGALAVMAPPTSAASRGLGPPPASTAGSTAAKGTVTTIVAGGWISQPAVMPTGSGDLQHCGFTYQALVTFHGAFDGVWHEVAMTAGCDTSRLPNTMPATGRGTGTLDVIYARDHSRGTFAWKGIWTFDAVTGQFQGVFDATSSSGDATFGCSSLHLTFDGYFPPTTTPFGGYTGKWRHVCPK